MCHTRNRPDSERSPGLSAVEIDIDDENVTTLILPRTERIQDGGHQLARLVDIL